MTSTLTDYPVMAAVRVLWDHCDDEEQFARELDMLGLAEMVDSFSTDFIVKPVE